MKQLERQIKRDGSGSPAPKKPREPTPDLTDVVSVLERKRRLTQWDMKPTGYDNVTAEQAKLSGMFPLPGAPRQQPMDPAKLQAFMNQPGNQASSSALKPSSARQSKRVMVHNLPATTTDESMVEFFNLQLNGLNVTRGVDPCISAQCSKDKTYALVEFKTPEDATNAMAFDGITMDPDAMDTNGDSNGAAKGLQIKRPKDYIVPNITDETENESGLLSNTVPDTHNKISITNLPSFLGEEQIQELLMSFGELKNFILVKDQSSGESRGIAFCEYKDSSVTKVAVDSLNGMELGDAAMRVKLASIGIQQVSSEMSVNAMSLMAGAKSNDAENGRVLALMNMITPEELMDPDDADGKTLLIFIPVLQILTLTSQKSSKMSRRSVPSTVLCSRSRCLDQQVVPARALVWAKSISSTRPRSTPQKRWQHWQAASSPIAQLLSRTLARSTSTLMLGKTSLADSSYPFTSAAAVVEME